MSNRKRATYAGILILVAYGVLVGEVTDQRMLVMLADVISGLAVIGIAVLLFPLFKQANEMLANAYLALKSVEGGLMIAGGLLYLSASTETIRDDIYNVFHIYAFIFSAYLFYYLLIKAKLIPRFISIWGFAGITALLLTTVLGLFDIGSSALDAFLVLIITNEVFLAIWLMAKGFNKNSIANN